MEISKSTRKKGVAGLYSIFMDTALTDSSLDFLLTFISFISKLSSKPDGPILEDYEKKLLFEQDDIIVPLSLEQQIRIHLQESIELGELPEETDTLKINKLLSSIYYGTPLVAHMTGEPLETLYIENLDDIFNRKMRNRRGEI